MSDEVSDEMSDEAMSVGEVAIDVSVPVGTTATLYFPAVGQKTDMFREDEDVHLPIYDGIRLASDVPGTKLIGYIDGKAILNISPGHHHFAFSPLKKE